MSEINEQGIYDKDTYEEISKVKGRGQMLRVPMSEIVEQMAVDYLNPKSKGPSEFAALVRGIIDYKEKKVSYIRTVPTGKDAFEPEYDPIKQAGDIHQFREKYIDFLDFITNVDPFQSALENQQRITNGGAVKDFEKKKILLLEIPMFWMPNVVDLGKNAWLQSLIRMPAPKLKNKREFQIGEIIKITFTNMSTYDGPKFVKFPVEGSPVFNDRISFGEEVLADIK